MAEEFDTTQKPKVTLIKQAKKQDAPETAPQAVAPAPSSVPLTEAEHAERRKVVVVKKKPAPAAPTTVVVKKPQPRVVTHATGEKPAESATPESAPIAAAAQPAAPAVTAPRSGTEYCC